MSAMTDQEFMEAALILAHGILSNPAHHHLDAENVADMAVYQAECVIRMVERKSQKARWGELVFRDEGAEE